MTTLHFGCLATTMMVVLASSGCINEDCPALDVESQRPVELDDAPELVMQIEDVRHTRTFDGTAIGSSQLHAEVQEVATLTAIDESYCGDTETLGYTADIVAIVEVTDRFTVELPARAGVTIDGAAALELLDGRHLADVTELAAMLPAVGGMVPVGIELVTDCATGRTNIGLWHVGEVCMNQQTCPLVEVDRFGSFARIASPQIGNALPSTACDDGP